MTLLSAAPMVPSAAETSVSALAQTSSKIAEAWNQMKMGDAMPLLNAYIGENNGVNNDVINRVAKLLLNTLQSE
jgi:hypothetical protein